MSAFTLKNPLEACASKTVVEFVLEVVTGNEPAVPTVQHATFEVDRAMVLGHFLEASRNSLGHLSKGSSYCV